MSRERGTSPDSTPAFFPRFPHFNLPDLHPGARSAFCLRGWSRWRSKETRGKRSKEDFRWG